MSPVGARTSRLAAAAAVAAVAGLVRGRRRPLPPRVGRPGAPAVAGGARRLRHPVLWPEPDPGELQPHAYRGDEEDHTRRPSRLAARMAWVTVVVALVGVVIVALAVVTRGLVPAVVGGVLVVVAAALGIRFRIMEEATVSQDIRDLGDG